MSETEAIDEIKERLTDLTGALRQVGAQPLATRLEAYAVGFTHVTEVRRSVNALHQQLEYWRQTPDELPESGKVLLAAGRLQDACKAALESGVIVPARPSLRAQSKRKLGVVVGTAAVALSVLAIPLGLTMLGVDLSDVHLHRELPAVALRQGEEAQVNLTALLASQHPELTTGAELYPAEGCSEGYLDRSSCAVVEPRLWASGSAKTFELRLADQAYGVPFAYTANKLVANIAEATLLIAATDDTPVGDYRIRTEARYLGYRADACPWMKRVLRRCEGGAADAELAHSGVATEEVVVHVLPGDPNRRAGEEQIKQRKAEEARKAAEERATQIAEAVTQVKSVLDDTRRLLRSRKYEDAHHNLQKLTQLFEPLEALPLDQRQRGAVGADVEPLRAAVDTLRATLAKFEAKAFDAAYQALAANTDEQFDENAVTERLAEKLAISRAYLEDIYTSRADEIQARLNAASQAELDSKRKAQQAVEARCGTLPTESWSAVKAYASARHPGTDVVLGQCLTPRVTADRCWIVTCDYKTVVVNDEDQSRTVEKHRESFFMRQNRVIGYGAPVEDE